LKKYIIFTIQKYYKIIKQKIWGFWWLSFESLFWFDRGIEKIHGIHKIRKGPQKGQFEGGPTTGPTDCPFWVTYFVFTLLVVPALPADSRHLPLYERYTHFVVLFDYFGFIYYFYNFHFWSQLSFSAQKFFLSKSFPPVSRYSFTDVVSYVATFNYIIPKNSLLWNRCTSTTDT